MPMQTIQNADFAARLGARVAAANAKHADAPVDTGNRRLPSGIRHGIAKLSAMYTKVSDADGGKTPKGETFFRASAIVMSPKSVKVDGQEVKVEGMVTQVVIPLCDTPAKGQRKEVSFDDNWFEFQNLFKMLGVNPPPKTATGQQVQDYYFGAMRHLTDPERAKTNPVYIEFSTRGWTPPATPQQPKPEEMVFEEWHGLAAPDAVAAVSRFDPAAGVRVGAPPSAPPTASPSANGSVAHTPPAPSAPPAPTQPAAVPATILTPPTPAAAPTQPAAPPVYADPDEVSALVEAAMADPNGETPEGAEASTRLEELAWAAGATREQTGGAADWSAVGEMALGVLAVVAPVAQTAPPANADPTVGSRWLFQKRTKEGEPLKNNKGEAFPPSEVEVTTVDAAAKTCTVKAVKDGKDVMDLRTKAPYVVKWEWLAAAPPY